MKSHDEMLSLLRSAAGDGAVGEDRGFSAESLKASLPAATFSAFEFDAALLFGSRVVFARPVSDMKPAALAAQLDESLADLPLDAAPRPRLRLAGHLRARARGGEHLLGVNLLARLTRPGLRRRLLPAFPLRGRCPDRGG